MNDLVKKRILPGAIILTALAVGGYIIINNGKSGGGGGNRVETNATPNGTPKKVEPEVEKLVVPTINSVTPITNTVCLKIELTNVEGAESYEVKMLGQDQIKSSVGKVLAWCDLEPETFYEFQARAVNKNDFSEWSNIVGGKTLKPNIDKLTPTNDGKDPAGVRDSTTVKALETKVFFPLSTELLPKDEPTKVTKTSELKTEPDGEAEITVNKCQKLHVFTDKGKEAKVSYSPKNATNLERVIRIANGVLTSFSEKCTDIVEKVYAGTVLIKTNGTWYTVRYFPELGDYTKEKFIVIVFEQKGILSSVGVFESEETPIATVRENQFMFFSADEKDVVLGEFKAGVVYDFPTTYDKAEALYKAFKMDKWIPRVLKIYEEDTSKDDTDKNNARFPVPTPSASPNSLEFGEVVIAGSDGKEEKVTVTNNSQTELNLTLAPPLLRYENSSLEDKAELKSGDPKEADSSVVYEIKTSDQRFTIDFEEKCKKLAPSSGKCVIKVRYFSGSSKEFKAKLILRHNADQKGEFESITLTGRGKVSKIVGLNSPGTLNFEGVKTGESKTASFKITNDSNTTFELNEFDKWIKSGTDNEFQIVKGCQKIEPSASCEVTVRFTPQKPGDRRAVLTYLLKNDPARGNPVELRGTGLAANISTDNLSFHTKVNSASNEKEITINVRGDVRAEIGELRIKNSDSSNDARFQLKKNNCTQQIGLQQSCTLIFVFNSKDADKRTATAQIPVKIFSADGRQLLAEELYSVELNGISVETPEMSCFEKIEKKVKKNSSEASAVQEIPIGKKGDSQGIIQKLEIVSTDNSRTEDFIIKDQNCIGQSGDKCSVKIGFTPRKRRTRRAILRVYYESRKIEIPINGSGKSRNWFLRIFFSSKDFLQGRQETPCKTK